MRTHKFLNEWGKAHAKRQYNMAVNERKRRNENRFRKLNNTQEIATMVRKIRNFVDKYFVAKYGRNHELHKNKANKIKKSIIASMMDSLNRKYSARNSRN